MTRRAASAAAPLLLPTVCALNPFLPCGSLNEAGGPTCAEPPVSSHGPVSLRPGGRDSSLAYFFGHGALNVASAVFAGIPNSRSPPYWPPKMTSVFTGKPPFGHFVGSVP